ncbi:galactoside alpha-(1,2)-fucosyltransferase 1-like [Paramacrobiotus metropolitanus]|uniref:galactoside alpha-(1,2)-fucosyltransferase 1-like n=1 Tax=Paramacrobiotus metropolitanus TaxID=2943436 RepID=UPI002446244F|nr:galactoside alpha-(1,2)-fucosyltransferase 1-like [Paramacrobiotus metropolitanus]
MVSRASCSISWNYVIKILLATGVFFLFIFIMHGYGGESAPGAAARLCASADARQRCRFHDPAAQKTAFPSHMFDRLERRVEGRLRAQCGSGSWNQTARVLAHDYGNSRGLGNYMFMLASTMGLAASSGRTPILDDVGDRLKMFKNFFPRRTTQDRKAAAYVTNMPLCGFYDPGLSPRLAANTTPSLLLSGYLQSYKFFLPIRDTIRCHFTFTPSTYTTAVAALKAHLQPFPVALLNSHRLIGMHVRRGDIVPGTASHKQGHTPASDQYLVDSYDALKAQYQSRTIFIVLSNDVRYCQRLFDGKGNIVYMEGNSAEVDLAVLTLMDDIVLTVGTYGWWGAYLSDAATVRYYDLWPRPGSAIAAEYNHTDFFPPHWTAAH